MRTIILMLTVCVVAGCVSSRHHGKTAMLDFYSGPVRPTRLPLLTLTQLEELIGTLPRERDETPDYRQGAWPKPNVSSTDRTRAEKAESEQQQPPVEMKTTSNFRPLHGELIASISVFPTESEDPEPPDAYGYSIFSDGIRSYPKRLLWRLDESSLMRLKQILDNGAQEPNQTPEPTAPSGRGSS